MPDGSPCSPRPSVDPNMYVLSEAIHSSMENSMALLSATMQQNALAMANTICEGFAARPSLEGDPHTLTKKRACTSSQVACDNSSGSLHKKSRTMVRDARTAEESPVHINVLELHAEKMGGLHSPACNTITCGVPMTYQSLLCP